jgi:hypothetical protein
VSCDDAVEVAVGFAQDRGRVIDVGRIRLIPSYGVAEGLGVRAWIVIARPSEGARYEVVVSAEDGRVIAHST